MTATPTIAISASGRELEAFHRVTFGRAADLLVDDNPYMHRIVGAFELHGDVWWLANEGSSTELTVLDRSGRRTTLPPGTRSALTTAGKVSWTSGSTPYELAYRVEATFEPTQSNPVSNGTNTVAFLPKLTAREIDFMVTAARHMLTGSRQPAPTYAEIAYLWGVKPKTVDNTIQKLKAKLAEAGVPASVSTPELASMLVGSGVITLAHLEAARLDDADGPVSHTPVR